MEPRCPPDIPSTAALAASGWWGKQFIDSENVHPLLFPSRDGKSLWPMNPVMAFSALGALRAAPQLRKASFSRPIGATNFATRARGSRRGCAPPATGVSTRPPWSTTSSPINDVFHRISDDAVLGAMDLKGVARPYFFVLRATTRSRCAETGISSERASSPGNRDRTHTQTYQSISLSGEGDAEVLSQRMFPVPAA